MIITLCGSIQFTETFLSLRSQLEAMGHTVHIPLTSERIHKGELNLEAFLQEKAMHGDGAYRKMADDVIMLHYNLIHNSDAILVVNQEKKGVPHYIGGNTFLEIGFAYILQKPIYLLEDIPNMAYTDEIVAMKPIVIHGDLSLIQ